MSNKRSKRVTRGRPSTEPALTAAERMRRLRERRKAAGLNAATAGVPEKPETAPTYSLFGGKVLSADSLKAMTTPGKGDYGLGVEIHDLGGNRVITHGGAIKGFSRYLAYVPNRRITVIVLGNVLGPAARPQPLESALKVT